MRRGGTSWFRLYPKIAENAADPGKGVRMSKTKHDCRVTPSNRCKQVQPCCLALALGRSNNELECCPEILPVGQLQAMPALRKGGRGFPCQVLTVGRQNSNTHIYAYPLFRSSGS